MNFIQSNTKNVIIIDPNYIMQTITYRSSKANIKCSGTFTVVKTNDEGIGELSTIRKMDGILHFNTDFPNNHLYVDIMSKSV